MPKTETNTEEANARGLRLKDYRESIGKTMDEFAALFELGKSTIEYWENARLKGLSRKGARKIAELSKELQQTGAISRSVSMLWLYDGNLAEEADPKNSLSEFSNDFLRNTENASVIEIQDNQFSPWLQKGDRIATVRINPEHNNKMNKLCLVYFSEYDMQPMLVEEIDGHGHAIAQTVYGNKVTSNISYERLEEIKWIHKA